MLFRSRKKLILAGYEKEMEARLYTGSGRHEQKDKELATAGCYSVLERYTGSSILSDARGQRVEGGDMKGSSSQMGSLMVFASDTTSSISALLRRRRMRHLI